MESLVHVARHGAFKETCLWSSPEPQSFLPPSMGRDAPTRRPKNNNYPNYGTHPSARRVVERLTALRMPHLRDFLLVCLKFALQTKYKGRREC